MGTMNKPLKDSIGQFRRQYFFTKTALFLFNSLYLLAGFGMCIVSFTLESKVFLKLLGEGVIISNLVAFSLEAAKLGTVVVYDFIDKKQAINKIELSAWNTLTSWILSIFKRSFQLSLFVISIVCVMTVVSEKFNQTEAIRAKDLATLKTEYTKTLQEITGRQQQEKIALTQKQKDAIKEIEDRYSPLITAENEGLKVERTNRGRGGKVRGDIYESHQEMLEKHTANRDKELANDKAAATQELKDQTQRHSQELTDLRTKTETQRGATKTSTYLSDPRVQLENVRTVVQTMNHVLLTLGVRHELLPVSFVALFSILLALIIESAIFLSFSSFVKSFYSPEFVMAEYELSTAEKKTT